ncbi:MAG: YceI family protein [Bacteroidetes bacterium]|nr:MAG: YceI family protein [Bacteroidota bacterium]
MKPERIALISLILILITGQAFVAQTGNAPEKKRISIQNSSQLFLTGTTNVNTFKCDCEDRYYPQSLVVESDENHARFSQARLRMTTRKFNCKNAKMDRDMHKALKAESYPYITIELLETWFDPEHLKNGGHSQWFDVKAKVRLTITNVTKEQFIDAKYKVSGKNSFTLRGSKSLKMTEYGIDPPEALFGLIQVDDLITFNFNLDIAVEDLPQ